MRVMSHDSTFDEFHRYRNTICVGSVFGVTHTTVFNACSMFAWIFYLPASSDTAGGGGSATPLQNCGFVTYVELKKNADGYFCAHILGADRRDGNFTI